MFVSTKKFIVGYNTLVKLFSKVKKEVINERE